MSQSHLPVQLSFVFVAVDSGVSFEELHTVEVRARLDHWHVDALKRVCKGGQFKPKTVTMGELVQQIEIHCQAFLKNSSFNYSDNVLECETKALTQNNAAQSSSLIHDVQCRVQLPETLIFDEEERVIHFIAELFAGYAYIEIIERVDGEDHLSVMTMGKGNMETNPFFDQAELKITVTVGENAPITTLKVSRSSATLNAFFDQLPAPCRSTPGERRDSAIMLIESELQDALDAQDHPDVQFQIEDRSHQAESPTIDFKCLALINPASFDQQMFTSTLLQSRLGLLTSL